MTVKQMVETLQQHHPHMGETEALILINDAIQDFCERTDIFTTLGSELTSVGDQLLYDVDLGADSNILKIKQVYIDNKISSRIIGKLNLKDIT